MQISAASDDQVAADTSALSGGTHTGAATFSFIQAIEQYARKGFAKVGHVSCRHGGNISYGQLLTNMHRVLDKGASAAPPPMSGGGGGLLGMLLGGSMAVGGAQRGQTPVMSSNEAFNLHEAFFL